MDEQVEQQTKPARPDATGAVVIGIDGSESARRALRFGLRLATAAGAPVHLVACWQRPLLFDAGGLGVAYPADDDLSTAAQAWLDETIEACKEEIDEARTAGCRIEAYTEVGAADLVLEELSKKAALLVIGRRGHNILERFLGTTSQHVIEHAQCPVTVIPTPKQ